MVTSWVAFAHHPASCLNCPCWEWHNRAQVPCSFQKESLAPPAGQEGVVQEPLVEKARPQVVLDGTLSLRARPKCQSL